MAPNTQEFIEMLANYCGARGAIRNIIEANRESRHFWHKSRSVHEFIIKIPEDICMLQMKLVGRIWNGYKYMAQNRLKTTDGIISRSRVFVDMTWWLRHRL